METLMADDRGIVMDAAGRMQFSGTTVPVSIRTTGSPRSVASIEVVDYIKPSIDSALAAQIMVASWRNVAEAGLADAWQTEIMKSFASGPSRWQKLSPRYAAWKAGRRSTIFAPTHGRSRGLASALYGTQSYVASAQANLILTTGILQNVMSAKEHVYVRKFGSPMITIDIDKQFESTPYVWLHEWGFGRIPMRDFIYRARESIAGIVAGLGISEFVVIDRAMKGDAVVTPEITAMTSVSIGEKSVTTPKVRSMVMSARLPNQLPIYTHKPASVSWGWLGRWFSKPWWWLVPPSKAYLYLGIYSDLRTILTQGISPTKMAIPFASAWGIGYTGAVIGVPLTKKTIRRRWRRTMWQRK